MHTVEDSGVTLGYRDRGTQYGAGFDLQKKRNGDAKSRLVQRNEIGAGMACVASSGWSGDWTFSDDEGVLALCRKRRRSALGSVKPSSS
jgi:hypothetical protein